MVFCFMGEALNIKYGPYGLTGGGCRREMCPLPCEARIKVSANGAQRPLKVNFLLK